MENLRTIQLTTQQIELLRAALAAVTPHALKEQGLSEDDLEEIELLDGMLESCVDMGDHEEVHAFWA